MVPMLLIPFSIKIHSSLSRLLCGLLVLVLLLGGAAISIATAAARLAHGRARRRLVRSKQLLARDSPVVRPV